MVERPAERVPSSSAAERNARRGTRERRVRAARAIVDGLLVFAALIALANLAGWIFGIEALLRVDEHHPAMVANTAIAVLASALALWVKRREAASSPVRTLAASLLALVPLLIGGVTILESLAHVSSALDRLLPMAGPRLPGFPVGRPASQAAVALVLLGLSIVGIEWRTRRGARPAEWLAAAAAGIGVLALAGYFYGAAVFYDRGGAGVWPTGTAIYTAVALLAVGAASFGIRPHTGAMRTLVGDLPGGRIARTAVAGGLLVALCAVLALVLERLGLLARDTALAMPSVAGILLGVWLLFREGVLVDSVYRDLRAATARLAEQQAESRRLFEAASDAIFVADLEGRYIDVNENACRLLGYPREGLIGRTIVDLLRPEDVPRLARSRTELLAGAEHRELWDLRRADGSFVPVELTAKILPDGRWEAIVRDVTDRLLAEQARDAALAAEAELRRNVQSLFDAAANERRWLRAVIDQLPEGILLMDANGKMAGTNRALLQLSSGDTGRTDEFGNAIRFVLTRPDGTPTPTESLPIVRALQEKRVVEAEELRVIRPDGAAVPIEASAAPILDENGALLGAVAISRDIRARKEAEERVSRERAWLRAVIDQMPVGVLLVDSRGNRIAENQAFLALSADVGARDSWGNPMRFDVRRPGGGHVATEDLPLGRAMRSGVEAPPEEFEFVLADGRHVPVVIRTSVVRDGAGAIIGGVATIQDVSAEKALARLREEWSSVVAHDLRQPIATIKLSAELLASPRPPAPAVVSKTVERIAAAALRLERMTDDLLDVSRLEARRMRIARARVEVEPFVYDVVDHCAAATVGHDVRVDVEPGLRAIDVDAGRIEQVLANLLSNAAKYGDAGAPILLSVRAVDGFADFAVTNRGRGIPADEIPKLFDRFHRSETSKTYGIPGLDLGLYICRGLVEAHGGRISVESTPGETTTFRLTLPFHEQRAETAARVDG